MAYSFVNMPERIEGHWKLIKEILQAQDINDWCPVVKLETSGQERQNQRKIACLGP
jgi:hypothetical protein